MLRVEENIRVDERSAHNLARVRAMISSVRVGEPPAIRMK
jgi:hypothetical protein